MKTSEILQPAIDEERLAFIEIVDRETQRVVTIIELLSPSNKQVGPGREQYLAKQAKILMSDAHLVEIDLLRGGPRMPWRTIAECDYCVVISRVERRPRADLVTIGLRDRLPSIPIPLKPGDQDASLDLQSLVHRIYDAAGYGYYIYRQPLEPPLGEADRAWADSLLPAAPRR